MSVVRLTVTALAMAASAAVLGVLAPEPAAALRTLRHAGRVAAAGGEVSVVLALTGLLAWATWAWGAVGLLLTAASGLPGLPGAVARVLSALLLPARLRAGAALALGLSLAVAGPAAAAPGVPAAPPDRPAAATGPPGPPDWPADAGRAGIHVVLAGDSLWRIAERRLDHPGTPASDAEVAAAVDAWWAANRGVIGADPDLIHPGQVLQPPADPDVAGEPR